MFAKSFVSAVTRGGRGLSRLAEGAVPARQMRAEFSKQLAGMYTQELPLYNKLVAASEQVNDSYMAAHPERDFGGDLSRVTQERHGAIRLGSPSEMRQVADLFGVFGMEPVGFYDFTTLQKPLPISCTAFRPVQPDEIAAAPFRMFTSLLDWHNSKFFSSEVTEMAVEHMAKRDVFCDGMRMLVAKHAKDGGLQEEDAQALVGYAVGAFRMPTEPIPKELYDRVKAEADIGADVVVGTQLNHLTPRVLDIDALRRLMLDEGVQMLEATQGPNPDGIRVQLRQDSFIAPKLPVKFELADGKIVDGEHTARFGEVEQRGAALTPKGREAISKLPDGYGELERQGLAYFTYGPTEKGLNTEKEELPNTMRELVGEGFVEAEYITYEDFLAQNARMIFTSTVADNRTREQGLKGTEAKEVSQLDRRQALSQVIGKGVIDPDMLYAGQQALSKKQCFARLGIEPAAEEALLIAEAIAQAGGLQK